MVLRQDGVSAIVPTRNHARLLPRLIRSLAGSEVLEVLVCDFRSEDNTVLQARSAGANVFVCEDNMHEGLNKTAERARGDILWFLSPWGRPPQKAGAYLPQDLARANTSCGCFRLQSLSGTPRAWLRTLRLNWGLSLGGETRLLHGPFLTWTGFESIGGIPPEGVGAAMRLAARKARLFVPPERIAFDADAWAKAVGPGDPFS